MLAVLLAAASLPAAAHARDCAAPEVRWARGVLADFWDAFLAPGEFGQGEALALLGPDLAGHLRARPAAGGDPLYWAAKRFRGAAASVTAVEVSPDRSEVVFRGRLAGREGGAPGGPAVRAEFAARVGREPGGRWVVRFLRVVERPAPPAVANP